MSKAGDQMGTMVDSQYDDSDNYEENDDGVFYFGEFMDEWLEESTAAPVQNTTKVGHPPLKGYQNLSELSHYKDQSFYPIFLILGCIVVLGVLTNILVCYIYRCRARRATSNFLVIFFAICDCAGCLVGPLWIFPTLALPYRFNSDAVCKIGSFVETCSVCVLCMTLLSAAYICYLQLCCGGGGLNRARYYSAAALGVSVVISIPALVVYSITPVNTPVPDIEGHACGLNFDLPRWLLLLYHVLVLTCFTAALAGMSVFYMLIFVNLYKQRQALYLGDKPSPAAKHFPKKHRFVREDTSSSSVAAGSYSEEMGRLHTGDKPSPAAKHFPKKHRFVREDTSASSVAAGSYSEEIGRLHTARTQCHTSTPHSASHHHHSQQYTDPARVPLKSGVDGRAAGTASCMYDRSGSRGAVKNLSQGTMKNSNSQQTSLLEKPDTAAATSGPVVSPVVQLNMKNTRQACIFLVISIVFVVFMLPYVVVTVLMATTRVFQQFTSTTTEVLVKLCFRSYLLNYLVKPVVYIIFNISFRDEVRKLFIKLWELLPFETSRPRQTPPQTEANTCSTPATQHRQVRSTSSSSIYRPAKTVL